MSLSLSRASLLVSSYALHGDSNRKFSKIYNGIILTPTMFQSCGAQGFVAFFHFLIPFVWCMCLCSVQFSSANRTMVTIETDNFHLTIRGVFRKYSPENVMPQNNNTSEMENPNNNFTCNTYQRSKTGRGSFK